MAFPGGRWDALSWNDTPKHPCKKIADPYMGGKIIEPLKLEGNESVKDFINNVYGNSGYNARKVAEACDILSRMIEDDATICLTLAGAMTPIGMSGPIIKLMELGFIDFIISTGANLYHDLHRAFDFPVVQGEEKADDNELNKKGIARIYDTYIKDEETLMATDKIIVEAIESMADHGSISSSELHFRLGEKVLKEAPHPEKSLVAMASKYNVPIYTSSPGDSSIGMNMCLPYIFGHKISIDPILDIIETTSIVRAAKTNGIFAIGGGSPKNFYLQTQPTLWQIFQDNSKGGHDYFIQLTTDSPQWGGLSGATPQEAKSWGKIKDAKKNNAVVYSCASITLPLIAQYIRMSNKPRKLKKLYAKRKELMESLLKDSVLNNPNLISAIKKNTSPENYDKIYKKIIEK